MKYKLFVRILSIVFLIILTFPTQAQIFEKNLPEAPVQTFTTTAYYSPLPSQEYYLTGSYEREIRLNGRGVAGADGTRVYYGMMAGPPNYAFGTKVCLESFGCGVIHDRGQAIVNKGVRKLARHDRIDLWMGYGTEGMLRALSWGVQDKKGKVYDKSVNIPVTVKNHQTSSLEELIEIPQKKFFSKNLKIGTEETKAVQELQKALIALDLFSGESSGVFDESLKAAVTEFQVKNLLIKNKSSSVAGTFGPKTRITLSDQLFHQEIQSRITKMWHEFQFEKVLESGDQSPNVFRLQQFLVEFEFLKERPTGFFGEKTEEALKNFQLSRKIIRRKTQSGAGRLGPKTKWVINKEIKNREDSKKVPQNEILFWQKIF